MIVTKEWLNEWIDLSDISSEEICEKLNSIGLEVESLTKQRVPDNVVLGKVIECEKHPNADKLNVTKVDIGGEVLQIVCGAKNVAKGQYVAVAKIGATLGNNFQIKEAKLRGVESYGMICSSFEIGLVKTNDGIMVLDDSIGELELGKPINQYPLINDDIIEIELTANRGDCLSIYGVARDLSAAFKKELKNKDELIQEDRRGIGRVLELDTLKKKYSALKYMFFEKADLKSNFLIDYRLYMCQEEVTHPVANVIKYSTINTGVILRGYDFDKFNHDNEYSKVKLTLNSDENGIEKVYDGENVVSIVGINQNPKYNIDENSQNILVEASFVKPEEISLKQYKYKLDSDELFYRSSRGSESDLKFGLQELEYIIDEKSRVYSGFEETIDEFEKEIIQIHKEFLDSFIGQEISDEFIITTLINLGFEVEFRGEFFIVTVPLYRSDIKHPQDLVEEILRIYGIDNITPKPLCFFERETINPTYDKIRKRRFYRDKFTGLGYYESISYIFDNKAELKEYGLDLVFPDMDIKNPITNELNTLRTTLCLNLLRSASKNAKNGKKQIKLFEIGKVFGKDLKEIEKVGFIFSGENLLEGLLNNNSIKECSFADIVKDLFYLVDKCEIKSANPSNTLFNPYEYGEIIRDNKVIGYIGRIHLEVEKKYGLKSSYLCELDFDHLRYSIIEAKEYSIYQSSQKDLAFVVNQDMKFEEIDKVLKENMPSNIISYYPIDIYKDETLGDKKSITIRFILQDFTKTLSDNDIKESLQQIIDTLKEKLNLEMR